MLTFNLSPNSIFRRAFRSSRQNPAATTAETPVVDRSTPVSATLEPTPEPATLQETTAVESVPKQVHVEPSTAKSRQAITPADRAELARFKSVLGDDDGAVSFANGIEFAAACVAKIRKQKEQVNDLKAQLEQSQQLATMLRKHSPKSDD